MTSETTEPSSPVASDRADAGRSGWTTPASGSSLPPKVRELFARRPTVGAGPAAQAVAADVSALVSAELDLAKAKLSAAATRKGMGLGMLVGAGVMGWLALQGLLVTAALALALVLPVWAAALIVSVVLLLLGLVLAVLGRSRLQTPLPTAEITGDLRSDADMVKARLSGRDQATATSVDGGAR